MATQIFGTIPNKETSKTVDSQKRKTFGFAYPIKRDNGGFFSKASGPNLVRNNLRQLLLTDRGERVMLPEYGTTVKTSLFQPFRS